MRHLDYSSIYQNRVNCWERLAGVYFLFLDKEIVYVGQTTNLYSRLAGHVNKEFDSFSLVTTEQENLLLFERQAIYKFCPQYNRGSRFTPKNRIDWRKLPHVLGIKPNQVRHAMLSDPLEIIKEGSIPSYYRQDEAYEWAIKHFGLPRPEEMHLRICQCCDKAIIMDNSTMCLACNADCEAFYAARPSCF